MSTYIVTDTEVEIKKYFKKTNSIIETAKYFKMDLKYAWQLFDQESLKIADDYSDAKEEIVLEYLKISEYFEKTLSIKKLALKYFNNDLDKAWNFIRDYNGCKDRLIDANDYCELYDIFLS